MLLIDVDESGPPSADFIKEMKKYTDNKPLENNKGMLAGMQNTSSSPGLCHLIRTLSVYNSSKTLTGLSSELRQYLQEEENEAEAQHSKGISYNIIQSPKEFHFLQLSYMEAP